ncbi:phage minor head protein [Mycolicibacterium neoaurum]|uniref:phage minor head protein n=1 Tax=Mycolicibacterium neoaurum TaxID=1795 RepID=UPI001F4C5B2D|nr:phage minor head protein [Mycolicibacterium neoaurum]
MTKSFDPDDKVEQYRLKGERHEARILQAMKGEFDRQRDFVLGKLATTPTPTKGMRRKDWLDEVVEWDDFDLQMARALAPILLGIIAETGQFAMQQVALDPSLFNVFNQAIQDYYNSRSTKVSKSVNDETEKQLRAALSQGIQSGETSYELRARVEKVFGFAATVRADRIARTETTTAQSFADIEAWGQSGVVESKEWYTALDERVCKFCRPMHGKTVGLKANYFDKGDVFEGDDGKTITLDYTDVQGPSLHNNCRCVLLPVLLEA